MKQMGAFLNIPDLIAGGPRRLLRLTLLAIGLLLAPTSIADPQSPRDGAPVSTSPDPSQPGELAKLPARRSGTKERLPLTRAAAQQRIDEMNPLVWLAHYGAVSIDRSE